MNIILLNNLNLKELIGFNYLFFGINYIILVKKDDAIIKLLEIKKIIIDNNISFLNNQNLINNAKFGIELNKDNIKSLTQNKYFLYSLDEEYFNLNVSIFNKKKNDIIISELYGKIGVNDIKNFINKNIFEYLKNIY